MLRALVDTGSEFPWIPTATLEDSGVVREKKDVTFTMANGQAIAGSLGFAILRVGSSFTMNDVVFGEPGDMTLLGARTLEGRTYLGRARVGGGFQAEAPRGCRTPARRTAPFLVRAPVTVARVR